MTTYFVGNILPPTNAQNSEDDKDPTFRFSADEARKLDLVGKPIRCEHEESLKCGTITKQMIDKTGKVYIIGKIDENVKANGKKNVISMFADKALGKQGDGRYYGSLSLQHVHEETVDGKTSKKAIEVSLVNEPRRPGCHILGVSRIPKNARHKASTRGRAEKMDEYICTPDDFNTEQLPNESYTISHKMESDSTTSTPAAVETTTPEPAAAPAAEPAAQQQPADAGKVGQAAPEKESDGDFKMGDVVNVVLQQETELDRLKLKLAEVTKDRDEHKSVNEARAKKEEEAKEKKRAADTERAEALMSTLTELWDEQVPDSVWQDNKDAQKAKMKKFIEQSPELAKDLFSVVHCASSRYAKVLNNDAERQRTLSTKLGHVMKKRKIHAASARAAPAAADSTPAPAAAPAQPQKKTLMSIMGNYSKGGMSGTATSLMNRLYKQQSERFSSPF